MMERLSLSKGEEEQQMELPPGFRFHPTDEELITHYLSPKVLDSCFIARAIGDVDLNKCEPWDLPWRAKMGEKEWYFFCVRDRKYPTGLRTNRATVAGYWKATGKDKEIHRGRTLVGMKKTLVFYRGRAPRGEKSNWVMHEYRLEGKFSYNAPSKPRNEWVICRVFQKSAGGKKTHISGLVMPRSIEEEREEIGGSFPQPLMEMSSQRLETDDETGGGGGGGATATSLREHHIPSRSVLEPERFGSPDWSLLREQSIMRMLVGKNCGGGEEAMLRDEYSQDTTSSHGMAHPVLDQHDRGGAGGAAGRDGGTTSGGPVDLYCLWNY